MIMPVIDPVLTTIRERDIDLHDRIVFSIAALSTHTAEVACAYTSAPQELMRNYQDGELQVRLSLAARPDLPLDVAEALARDTSEQVRVDLARNQSISAQTLAILALDSDTWVKRAVHRHPHATNEIKATVALTTSPEELLPPTSNLSPYIDPATPLDKLRAYAAAAIAGDPIAMSNLHYLVRNPSLPEDLIPELIPISRERSQWIGLWDRNRVVQPSRLWLSTLAFTDLRTPSWVLEALTQAGHPAALVTIGANVQPLSCPASEALMQLIDSELLTVALWRELARDGIVELNYWNDEYEGDKFFPTLRKAELLHSYSSLMDPDGPAQFIVSGWSETRDWILREDSLSIESIYRTASFSMEDVVQHLDPELAEVSVDTFAMIGIAYATEEGRLNLSLTPAGELAFQAHSKNLNFESNDYETTVTIVDGALTSIGYADTTRAQKLTLVQLLLDSRVDPRINLWGIGNHFLACLALHPDTPEPVLNLLLAESEGSATQPEMV